MGDSAPWWKSFFDDFYADFGLRGADPEKVAQVADGLMQTLGLKPGDTLFDQCCGVGRLSLPLAERGARVTGVDITAAYIEDARRRAAERSLPCEFHCADAHDFAAPAPCDAAINWFTSFGYDEDDAENLKILRRAFESLKPGGSFMLDYMNVPAILADFRPHMISRPDKPGMEGLVVLHETQLDFAAGMTRSDWTFLHPDGRRDVRQVQTRLMLPHEMIRLFKMAGFEDIRLMGCPSGREFQVRSGRCVVLGRRPG